MSRCTTAFTTTSSCLVGTRSVCARATPPASLHVIHRARSRVLSASAERLRRPQQGVIQQHQRVPAGVRPPLRLFGRHAAARRRVQRRWVLDAHTWTRGHGVQYVWPTQSVSRLTLVAVSAGYRNNTCILTPGDPVYADIASCDANSVSALCCCLPLLPRAMVPCSP